MKQSGYTMMVVEQNAAKALAVADRAYVLELGRNRFEGPGRTLLEDPRSSGCTWGAEPGPVARPGDCEFSD